VIGRNRECRERFAGDDTEPGPVRNNGGLTKSLNTTINYIATDVLDVVRTHRDELIVSVRPWPQPPGEKSQKPPNACMLEPVIHQVVDSPPTCVTRSFQTC
jgi:hypothetical protein